MNTLLHATIESSRYGAIEALRNVEIDVAEGEVVAVLGGNGVGKTTLLRTISGVLVRSAAKIMLAGENISRLSAPRRVRAGVVHIPEGRRVFGDLTVAENLAVAAYAKKLSNADALVGRDQACDLFPILKERWDQPAASLSGGEQQMLAIGRGLISRPRLLMVDEASHGLAPSLVEEVFAALSRLRDEGLAILLVEQNARAALRIAARAYIFERGTVALSGDPDELLSDQRVASIYLGGTAEESMETGNGRVEMQAENTKE